MTATATATRNRSTQAHDLTRLGAAVPGSRTPALALTRSHPRFVQVRLRRLGREPRVAPGQVWADCDPRARGRLVEVVAIAPDGRALLRTVRGGGTRTGVLARPTSTPEGDQQQASTAAGRGRPGRSVTPGERAHTSAALWRFTAGSRGYRLVAAAPVPDDLRPITEPSDQTVAMDPVDALADLLAAGASVSSGDRRCAAALVAMLGAVDARAFVLDACAYGDPAWQEYAAGDPSALLASACRAV